MQKLSDRQLALLRQLVLSDKPQLLLHGPVGTSKTTLGALWLLCKSQASYGCRFGLLHVTQTQALAGAIETLMELCPGVKRVNDKTYNMPSCYGKPNKLLVFTANKRGDHQKIKSYNLSGGLVDEITEIPQEAYGSFIGRMRVGKNPQVLSMTNPRGQAHWVYRQFIDEHRDELAKRLTDSFPTTHNDNPSLPDGYVDNLMATHTGHELERNVRGVWVDVMGLAFPECLRSVTDEEPDWGTVQCVDIGLDVGWSGTSHAVSVAFDADGVAWVVGEWVHNHRKHGELSSEMKVKATLEALAPRDVPLGYFTIDRSAVEVVDTASRLMRGTGVRVFNAYDVHGAGVDICEQWAAIDGLRICAHLAPVLVSELQRVCWDELKALVGRDELDSKVERHGTDAFRYAITRRHIEDHGGVREWEMRRRDVYGL